MTRIAFILNQLELESPGQQLLDRFLIGYNQNGGFKASTSKVSISVPGAAENRLVQMRTKEFGLEIAESVEGALAQADLVIVAPGTKKYEEHSELKLPSGLSTLAPGKAVYLDAALLLNPDLVNVVRQLRESRSVAILSSRAASHLVPLPVKPAFSGDDVEKLLIVVQGVFPEAELDALYAIQPYLGTAWTQRGSPTIKLLQNSELWDFAYSSTWRPLLEAAISRSDNMKGDPDRDGRTQDIVGLRLIEKLAPKARGCHLQHPKGLRIALLVLDRALTDFNFAAAVRGKVYSAQLYHPQAPMDDHYNDLAASIFDHFAKEPVQGNLPKAVFLADILQTMRQTHSGSR